MANSNKYTCLTLEQRKWKLLEKYPEIESISKSQIQYYHQKFGISAKKPTMI